VKKLTIYVMFLALLVFGGLELSVLFAQSKAKPDIYENDNTIEKAKAIKINEAQERTLTDINDIDWVKITITKADSYLFSADKLGNSMEPTMQLFSSKKVFFEEGRHNSMVGNCQIISFLHPGTYYLRVYTISESVFQLPEGKPNYTLRYYVIEAKG